MELKKERKYEFRKRMRQVHKRDIRDLSVIKNEGDFEFSNGISICLPDEYDEVIYTAAKDFTDYLFVSMGVSSRICYGEEAALVLKVDKVIDEDYIIDLKNGVMTGKSSRALAQALYCLEDKMNIRKAPFASCETIKHTFMFSPRMVHSGYALDEFPDEHLAEIAHAGMDAILLFVKDVNFTTAGFLDFNDLIARAQKYGIDVYAYSYLKSELHPDDEGAQQFYDNLYGRLFRECPGFRGVILVGESVAFPSRDEHVAQGIDGEAIAGVPQGKPKPCYWPCNDFPKWLDIVKKSIYKYKEDADIVFWTYNWGYVDEKARLELINALPTDISLMATYEMFENYPHGDIFQTCADYTLSFTGPGKYFTSEAEAAKKRGIRLYAMTNTAGLTWDIGTIPYEPFPYQWIERHKGMREAYEKWGLCGIMDSHHYGFWPSFIGDMAKQNFILENGDCEENLTNVLKARYGENIEKIKAALKNWSEGIKYYTPTDADQYGAFRVGPAYPLCLIKDVKPPSEEFAHFGNTIMEVSYPADYAPYTALPYGRGMLPSLRVKSEIASLEKMYSLIIDGVEILEAIENSCEELLYLINLGKYISCCVKSGINAKKWYMTVAKIKSEFDGDKIKDLIRDAKKLILEERENAVCAIKFVEYDSRLGYEPSMDYMADKEHIEWKIRHLDYVYEYEIKAYENGSDDKWRVK